MQNGSIAPQANDEVDNFTHPLLLLFAESDGISLVSNLAKLLQCLWLEHHSELLMLL